MYLIRIIGRFRKEDLDEIIQYANKYNIEKQIGFSETPNYNKKDGFSTYQCLYPYFPRGNAGDLSKSEMLYLQIHGFIFRREDGKIVDVETLDE